MSATKQITKDIILNAALKLLREQGYEAVNIKRLAKELGCSTQPVYLSFAGMEALRSELTLVAAAEFERRMKADCKGEKIRLYEMDYIRFAQKEPRLFCYLFMREKSFTEIKQILLDIIEKSIKELMDAYHISHEEADVLHDQLWMHAHGIASMIATDFCNWDMEKVDRMLTECKLAFTNKYEV